MVGPAQFGTASVCPGPGASEQLHFLRNRVVSFNMGCVGNTDDVLSLSFLFVLFSTYLDARGAKEVYLLGTPQRSQHHHAERSILLVLGKQFQGELRLVFSVSEGVRTDSESVLSSRLVLGRTSAFFLCIFYFLLP